MLASSPTTATSKGRSVLQVQTVIRGNSHRKGFGPQNHSNINLNTNLELRTSYLLTLTFADYLMIPEFLVNLDNVLVYSIEL